MRSDPMLNVGFKKAPKYLPSPHNKQLILNYFHYNNFQDFNTWQQIAKTKLDYDYHEDPKHFICSLVLKWEDRQTPQIHAKGEANSKKTAKRRALIQLVDTLICQGFIARGFKDEHFVDKLPRRRKHESDDSGEQVEEEHFVENHELVNWLETGKYQLVIEWLTSKGHQLGYADIYQVWNYGLKSRNISFLVKILKSLSIESSTCEQMSEEEEEMENANERQFFEGCSVKESVAEDLTDFMRPYQLQKQLRSSVVRSTQLAIRPLPSEHVLIKAMTPSPSQDQLRQHFHPIQASTLVLQKCQSKPTSFLGPFEGVELPCFEKQGIEVSIRYIELLYSLLFFYCQDISFCRKVLNILKKHLSTVSIAFPKSIQDSARSKAQDYYVKQKGYMTSEFVEKLSTSMYGYKEGINIEGMLTSCQYEPHMYQFKALEPENIVNRKLKKVNFSEFEESAQISNRGFIVLLSKITGKWVGQVIELSPTIKVHIPGIGKDLDEPHPVTMFGLCNPKIFEKTSTALVEACCNCLDLLEDKCYLLWQPPTFPEVAVMAQLLLQWQQSRQSILIISPYPEQLYAQLIEQGFKTIKLTSKTQQKAVARNPVVVTSPEAVSCDLLRNYAFTRVLVQAAQAVPENRVLPAVVKDCEQLWLIGDAYLPARLVRKETSLQLGRSLFQRLLGQGRRAYTYSSKQEELVHHANVMEWANQFVYAGKLQLLGDLQQLPVVKGFPWPSYEHRICFLQVGSFLPQQEYLRKLAKICAVLSQQILQTGYTSAEQIGCSVCSLEGMYFLKQEMGTMLTGMGVADQKLLDKLISKMVRLVTGCSYALADLCILLVGAQSRGLPDIIGALVQGRRGIIMLGDCLSLIQDPAWNSLIGWCRQHKLILEINKPH